jgi:hypothetical protein
MSQAYSDPTRENDPYALPDLEIFHTSGLDPELTCEDGTCLEAGWYYWFCFPGCMPEGEAIGPFDTETAALADARTVQSISRR